MWQEFSKKVCSDLDMWNAYDYIHIEQEAVPSHLGGNGKAVLSFNQSFFNGKYGKVDYIIPDRIDIQVEVSALKYKCSSQTLTPLKIVFSRTFTNFAFAVGLYRYLIKITLWNLIVLNIATST